jgi:hypothetical protein
LWRKGQQKLQFCRVSQMTGSLLYI